MRNKVVIYKDMTPHARRPYRLADVFNTLEGPRTRLSSLCYATYEDAMAAALAAMNKETHNGD